MCINISHDRKITEGTQRAVPKIFIYGYIIISIALFFIFYFGENIFNVDGIYENTSRNICIEIKKAKLKCLDSILIKTNIIILINKFQGILMFIFLFSYFLNKKIIIKYTLPYIFCALFFIFSSVMENFSFKLYTFPMPVVFFMSMFVHFLLWACLFAISQGDIDAKSGS